MSNSNVWFTSDLHLGHKGVAYHRGYTTVEYHDSEILNNFQKLIGKRDKLFILGDVAWNNQSLPLIGEIPGVKELIVGNHDTYTTKEYLKYFNKVHGFRGYKGFWLSHPPIHEQEIYRKRGNIHGHIHKGAHTKPLPYPYFNVNVDFNDMKPVNLDTILDWFQEQEHE